MAEDETVLPDLVPPTSPGGSRAVIQRSLVALETHLGLEVSCCGLREPGVHDVHCVDLDGSVTVKTAGAVPVTGGGMLLLDRRTEGPVVPSPPPVVALPPGLDDVGLVRSDGQRLGHLYAPGPVIDALSDSDVAVLRMFAELIASHLTLLVDEDRRWDRTRSQVEALMADGGPSMALQPIVEVDSGAVHSYEALARFEEEGSPQQWFDAAAAVGLGAELELAAVRSAVRLLPRLRGDVRLSVNVSAESLVRDELLDVFTGEHAERLIVELTEHTRVDAYPDLAGRLETMRAAGALLAVDDAGSGYSGLEHILALQPDLVKLDQVLVQGIAHHAGRQAVAEAMVGLARRMGARIVAEGVESERDLAMLRELGVGLAQGYLVGHPVLDASA